MNDIPIIETNVIKAVTDMLIAIIHCKTLNEISGLYGNLIEE